MARGRIIGNASNSARHQQDRGEFMVGSWWDHGDPATLIRDLGLVDRAISRAGQAGLSGVLVSGQLNPPRNGEGDRLEAVEG